MDDMDDTISCNLLKDVHHIGIVVPDVATAISEYSSVFGVSAKPFYEDVLTQSVRIGLIPVKDIYFEFIEPYSENSPVGGFLKNGGGFHHICFEVDDVHASIAEMRNSTVVVVEPVYGFQKRLTAFVWLKKPVMGFRLVEIASKKRWKS